MESLDMWNELPDKDKEELRKAGDREIQRNMLEFEQSIIETNKEIIVRMKELIKETIGKENYTDTSKEIVRSALGIIKDCEADIKKSEKEILMLARYPVGSNKRKGIKYEKSK